MGFCSKGKGNAAIKVAAIAAATAIVGPAAIPMVMPFLGSNPTPAQQQQYDSAAAYNQQVAASNSQRQEFIDKYVEKQMGAPSDTEIQMGNAFKEIAKDAKADFGDDVMGMTLTQFRAAHPKEAALYFDKFKKMVPEAAPYTMDQILSETPDSLKNVPMSKLLEVYPSGGALATIGKAIASPIGIGAAIIAVIVLIFLSKKKKSSSVVVG
jgi:hypothetical protein